MGVFQYFDLPGVLTRYLALLGIVANKGATSIFLNHSDIVSTTGAFVVGLLGNIYSRVCGGTAFTAMVPGVLVLVPVRTRAFFSRIEYLLKVVDFT